MHTHETWEEAIHRYATLSREEMIDAICTSGGYITALPQEQQGRFLFGKTKNGRAVCLLGREDNEGRVTSSLMRQAREEIVKASLKVPFLFFGTTCIVECESIFTFAQIPYCFESGALLKILQVMNMRANLHTATSSNRVHSPA